jgi:hypothetical protein
MPVDEGDPEGVPICAPSYDVPPWFHTSNSPHGSVRHLQRDNVILDRTILTRWPQASD